ncbi:MAG: hypothetical protein OEX10_07540 [Candidatus Bathyarchaeota archaeon]|nr:hypothetical protein [Candidatus Bathyarchaeota archaeon]
MRAQPSKTWLTCRPLAFCSFSGDDNYTTSETPAQASTQLRRVVVGSFPNLLPTTTPTFQISCPPPKRLSLEVVVVDKRRKKPTTTLSDFKVA